MQLIFEDETLLEDEFLFEMAKLTRKRADKRFGDFGEFIYFSHKNSSHSPRVKFYGGTPETATTRNAPSMKFDHDGNSELVPTDNLTKKNCPNAFDSKYLKKVANFIKETLPVLLLTWYDKLDESDALAFLEGRDSLPEMIDCIYNVHDELIDEMKQCKNIHVLHTFCKNNNIYKEEQINPKTHY